MSFNNTIQNLEINDNLETVLNLLQDVAPANQKIKDQLGKISKNRNTFITQLQEKWHSRTRPTHTELDIKTLNTQFYADEDLNEIIAEANGRTQCKMGSRDWIIRGADKWIGWDAENSQYFPLPILFEGPLDFQRNFENLVVSDRESGSINLIWTISKVLDKGINMCLSDANWISCFLHLGKSYLPNSYQAMSRYSANLEGLFTTLVSSVNGDHEIAKLRTCMSKLSRKPGEMVQACLYKLRAQYEMILQISFPAMDEATITLRADNYASNCAKFFVSSKTGVICEQYISYKISRGNENTVLKISNLITQHEAINAHDRITTIHSLPDSACRLDLQMYQCANIEDLMVQTAQMQVSDRRSKSPYQPSKRYSKSPSQNRQSYPYKNQSRSPSTERQHRPNSRGREHQNREHRKENYHQGRNRSKTNSKDRYPKKRNTSTHKDKPQGDKNRSSYQRNHYEKSKSPSSRTRGRTPVQGDARQVTCVRCGDPHYGNACTKYVYYDGEPCSICNFLHKTRDHRGRSTSVDKNSQHNGARKRPHIPDFKYRDLDGFQSQIQGANLQSDEPIDFNLFNKKN